MRPIPFLAAVLTLVLPAMPALAAPPSGTITCASLVGEMDFFEGLPSIKDPPRTIRVKVKDAQSDCDASGVTGGLDTIATVSLDVRGQLPGTTTCVELREAPPFQKTRLAARWLTAPGRSVGRSKAALASATYDSGTKELVLVTEPIGRGAFVGSTLTFRLALLFDYDGVCGTGDGPPWANLFIVAPSSVSVP